MPTAPTYSDNVEWIATAIFDRLRRERWQFIRDVFPDTNLTDRWGSATKNKSLLDPTTETVGGSSSTAWATYWSIDKVPRGTLVHLSAVYSSAHAVRFAIANASPNDYYTSHSSSIVGCPYDDMLYNESILSHDVWFEIPRDAYVIFSRTTQHVTTALSIRYTPLDTFKLASQNN